MINTDKINSIIGKVFSALAAIAIFLPFLEGIDLGGLESAIIQVIGGVVFIINTIWRLRSKDSNEQAIEKIAEATVAKLKK